MPPAPIRHQTSAGRARIPHRAAPAAYAPTTARAATDATHPQDLNQSLTPHEILALLNCSPLSAAAVPVSNAELIAAPTARAASAYGINVTHSSTSSWVSITAWHQNGEYVGA
ncbi:MAG: hypothetical protein RL328_269 [Acidobacteriota bacterium]